MTSWRPDRPPLDPMAALVQLRAEAGTRFDPEVVEALCTEVGRMPCAPPADAGQRLATSARP